MVVERFEQTGVGNIVLDAGLAVEWALVFVRIHWDDKWTTGTPDSNRAAVKITRLHREAQEIVDDSDEWIKDSVHELVLWTTEIKGYDADLNFRVNEEERLAWSFAPNDRIRVSWNDPTEGTTDWGVEVGLIRIGGDQRAPIR